MTTPSHKQYIGVDIGGTKIAAGIVDAAGSVVTRIKIPTPPKAKSKELLRLLTQLINNICREADISIDQISGIGIGVPGIVANDHSKILITPNIDFSGFNLQKRLAKTFPGTIVAGNDVNLGLLGEQWLGAGKDAHNIIGISPGTGVGGAIIIDGQLLTGTHGAAGEIGHMLVDPQGPACSCGNRGCLEAIAGRWAIERDLKAAMAAGIKTCVSDLLDKDSPRIKSKILKDALKKKDPLVTGMMEHISTALAHACISLKHIFDPEMFILGGGVIEACDFFILPIIRRIVKSDPFFSGLTHTRIVASRLGDDAVILGAAALVRQIRGDRDMPEGSPYPEIRFDADAPAVHIDGKPYTDNVFIRADGKIKKLTHTPAAQAQNTLTVAEIKKILKKDPQTIFIGMTAPDPTAVLTGEARDLLLQKNIPARIFAIPKAIQAFADDDKPRALYVQLSPPKATPPTTKN